MTENLFNVLGVLTAFITVMLIFSIAVTSLVQATQGLLRWRARNLQNSLAKILGSALGEGHGRNTREDAIAILNEADAALINTKLDPKGMVSRFFGPQLSWMEPDELDRELLKQRKLGLTYEQKTDVSQKFRRSHHVMRKVFLRRVRLATIGWAFVIAVYYQISAPALLEELSADPQLVAQLEEQGRDMLQHADEGDPDDETKGAAEEGVASRAFFQLQPWQDGWCFFYHSKKADPECKAAATDPPGSWFERMQWSNIIGMLITVSLLSLGAPFWFDMLKSVVNLKDTIAREGNSDDSGDPKTGAAQETKSTDDRIELLTERMYATNNPIIKASLQKEINDLRLIKAEYP